MPGYGQNRRILYGVKSLSRECFLGVAKIKGVKLLSRKRCLGVTKIDRHCMGLSHLAKKDAIGT